MDYAIIRVGGKQYRVREGETLVVDRLKTDEGNTFTPDVLLGAEGATVTAKVVAHERGPKVRIGKYRKRTGYKRHTGHRSALTRIQIESIGKAASGAKRAAAKPAAKAAPAPVEAAPAPVEAAAVEAAPVEAPTPAGLPEGYEGSTVAQIQAAVASWSRGELEAALAHEQAHGKRKGAIAALTSAIKKEGDD